MFLFPYSPGSQSSMSLAKNLGIKQIKHQNSSFKGSNNKVVLNWGSSSYPDEIDKCIVINNKNAVCIAANKLSAFKKLSGIVPIPEFTTDKEQACDWLDEGKTVFARHKLSGSSGEGIVVLTTKVQMEEDAPLYTLYIPKVDEYRIHVHKGRVFFIQRKAVKEGTQNVNWKIRSHKGGFIFQHKNVDEIPVACDIAIKAVECLGLDFGAVDIIYNKFRDTFYLLEINTAPGIEGMTLQKYTEEMSIYK